MGPIQIEAQRGQGGGRGPQTPQELGAWLHVGADGRVTVYSGKVEVGQNVRTSLAMAVAEELRVPLASIHMILGDTDLCPFDQGTFGSRSTPAMAPQLRRAAAAAREALLDLAAKKWGVARSELRAENGRVLRTSGSNGQELSYGDLAKDVPSNHPIPNDIALTPAKDWKIMGKSAEKVEGRQIVTGTHKYTIDHTAPGMLHAKILRPLALNSDMVSADTSKAEKMPGVKIVRDGNFLGVAAPTARLAEQALMSIASEWKEKPQPSSKDLEGILRGGERPASVGLPGAAKNLNVSYSCPYISHVPLEPRAALAEWDGKKMTVHTGTQRPFGVRSEVAEACGLSETQVRVIVPDTGSGYGGKHSGDAAVEAARMAKALGKPIKLVWTRNEEFTFAYFRPAGIADVVAGASAEGKLAYWQFTNYNSGNAGLNTPYDVAEPRQQFRRAESPLRQGSYRALASTFNHFARESAMDELAHACGLDPVEFRLKNLKNERLAEVLKTALSEFGWGSAAPQGRGYGIACGTEKGGFVATAVEVQASKEAGQVRVLRCVTAYECGAIVNPLHCDNQVMGSVLQGLGGALFEQIEFENGRILNGWMVRYRVPRYSDIPAIKVVGLDRKDLPSAGAGEFAIVAIAPAIANAIFAATGVRLRSLPLRFAT
jgi:isoquinoline 1-oxidoreductase